MKAVVSDAVERLLDSGAVGEEMLILTHDEDSQDLKQGIVWRTEHLYAQSMHDHADRSGWRLTATGRALLQPCFVLQEPCRLQHFHDQDIADMQIFELLERLASVGCMGVVFISEKKVKQKRRKNAEHVAPSLRKPKPFVPGDPLRW